jgi:hypothetical protein
MTHKLFLSRGLKQKTRKTWKINLLNNDRNDYSKKKGSTPKKGLQDLKDCLMFCILINKFNYLLSQIKLKRGRFFNEISGNEVQPFNIILESKLARTGLDDEVTRPFKQIFEKISLLDHHKHISSGLYD